MTKFNIILKLWGNFLYSNISSVYCFINMITLLRTHLPTKSTYQMLLLSTELCPNSLFFALWSIIKFLSTKFSSSSGWLTYSSWNILAAGSLHLSLNGYLKCSTFYPEDLLHFNSLSKDSPRIPLWKSTMLPWTYGNHFFNEIVSSIERK